MPDFKIVVKAEIETTVNVTADSAEDAEALVRAEDFRLPSIPADWDLTTMTVGQQSPPLVVTSTPKHHMDVPYATYAGHGRPQRVRFHGRFGFSPEPTYAVLRPIKGKVQVLDANNERITSFGYAVRFWAEVID